MDNNQSFKVMAKAKQSEFFSENMINSLLAYVDALCPS